MITIVCDYTFITYSKTLTINKDWKDAKDENSIDHLKRQKS